MNIQWDAEKYMSNFSFVHKYGNSVTELIEAPEGSRVMDLGCGNGALTQEELFSLIRKKAEADERIRAAALDGSRANPAALHDEYSDFDVVLFVRDSREFTQNTGWISDYGEVLIAQFPDDWHDHPYDYGGREPFHCLVQYADGNRIDFTIRDVSRGEEENNREPRTVLIDKDGYDWLKPVKTDEAFFTKRPGKKEYLDCVNEFRWLSLYVAKGLCRDQFNYARFHLSEGMGGMFLKMLDWKIGLSHDFRVSTGAHGKYLKKYLTEEEMARVRAAFPDGETAHMWEGLEVMYDYFEELAEVVADGLGYPYDQKEAESVKKFWQERRKNETQKGG
ncbi:MAG TPA: aminoglycoside 6-adenylyltransferase [Candidatus Eisenbergiella stercoravium]|nr:aminoglycoside 6-adenylyltransferase [Candidatus Eisenbergiella stercoravium]